MNIVLHVKYPLFLFDFNENLNFLDRFFFSEKTQLSDFKKIFTVGADLFHADGRRDGQTF